MGGIDVSMKHAMAEFPQDWAELVGVRKVTPVRIVDSDVSTVATLADKVIEVLGAKPFVLHLEPQAYYDKSLDIRMFEANGRLTKRHEQFVHTCVLVLDRRAWGRGNSGRYHGKSSLGGCRVDFQYDILKVWELPVQKVLTAGIGLLPLAPVCNVPRDGVPEVVRRMSERFSAEVPRAVESELWTATFVLLGLRYDRAVAQTLLRGVREIMRESSTYQLIVEEGLAEGMAKGMAKGLAKGLAEGLAEGLTQGVTQGVEKGRVTARREDILKIGAKRFGKPPRKVREAITELSDLDRLDALLDRVLDVPSWSELLAD